MFTPLPLFLLCIFALFIAQKKPKSYTLHKIIISLASIYLESWIPPEHINCDVQSQFSGEIIMLNYRNYRFR